MRVKEPSVWGDPEKTKRCKRANRPLEEDSSDDIAGLTCHHVSQAVDVNQVKRAVSQAVWSVCTECMKERRTKDGELVTPADVWLCLKCGHQGCGASAECQHSLRHFRTPHLEPHCIAINLSTWVTWCYDCDEELLTHCNKKQLAQAVDFLQKHASRSAKGSSSKVIRLQVEKSDVPDIQQGKSTSVPVKGINNLGNTCFFNAVMQNLAQTHMLNEALNEMKEKCTKLKICLSAELNLDPLVISLSSPGPLTSAVLLFLHSMKEAGKEPISPKVLFSQLCQKAPRFKAFQQQDSQELLHYLLDAIRTEETKRIQSGILKAFNNPTTKTADEETKRKVKAYGKEGVKMNFIDRIFVGELTSTVMCEECGNISAVKEAFIDLSLPIIEERVSKPATSGRGSKGKNGTEENTSPCNLNNNLPVRIHRKHSLTKDKNQLNQGQKQTRQSVSDNDNRSLVIMQANNDVPNMDTITKDVYSPDPKAILCSLPVASQSEGSEKEDLSQSESSGDADSEASEYENSTIQTVPRRTSFVSGGHPNNNKHMDSESCHVLHNSADCDHDAIMGALSKLSLNTTEENSESFKGDQPVGFINGLSSSLTKCMFSQSPQSAFQTLSLGYVTSSKECSVQSCLYQFTSVELLMGNNKLLCESCTENRLRYQRKTNHTEQKQESVYTSARKQLLISAAPANLILHLKRFYQNGLTLRKINRHVDFPLILDLAPFCSALCKNVLEEKLVLYGLYGIVVHTGSMREGHYTAYVKVRVPSRKGTENISNKNSAGLKDVPIMSSSQWVYVSDTHVQMVSESRVLSSQAYLLFYERLQ
ncbi:ubiquitin carboxyl-terminal hydrolase 45 [Rhinophrynus dorsalis]